MKPFLTIEEEGLLVGMIRNQEARTSAEIRVCVTYRFAIRPEPHAWRMFDEIGMRNTRRRNGVLIVMMPRMKKVVMIGDRGVDAVVPEGFWKESVAAMIRQMHEAGPLDALGEGLRRLGDLLSTHWPREADDVNELPDDIVQ